MRKNTYWKFMKFIVKLLLVFATVCTMLEITTLQAMKKRSRGEDETSTKRRKTTVYTINLMWINASLNEHQRYIHPSETPEKLLENLHNVFIWAHQNPESIVNIWFDGELSTVLAIKNTQACINEYLAQNPNFAPIILRDVREISDVIKNNAIFDNPLIPVYFRADLLRVMATVHAISLGETECFVYADLDVVPPLKEKLFNQETKERLEKYGIVVAEGGHLGFENSFHMATNDQHIVEAMQLLLINLNIARADNALAGNFWSPYHRKGNCKALEQVVYDSYPAMFKYLFHLKKYGILVVMGEVKNNVDESVNKDLVPYDKHVHALDSFGLNYFKESEHWLMIDGQVAKCSVPMKRVKRPPSKFGGSGGDNGEGL